MRGEKGLDAARENMHDKNTVCTNDAALVTCSTMVQRENETWFERQESCELLRIGQPDATRCDFRKEVLQVFSFKKSHGAS